MQNVLLTLWPLFALIALGAILRRNKTFEPAFWVGAEKLNYFLLFPALLINSLAKAPLNDPQLFHLAGAIFSVVITITILCVIIKKITGWNAGRFGAIVQGNIRFNTYLGLAIVADLFGTSGLGIAALILAILVPLSNVTSVLSLTAGQNVTLRQLILPIIKNPLIISCVIGIIINLSGIGLPLGSDQFLKLLAATSLPLGLICIGAALHISTLKAESKMICINTISRLTIVPIIAYAIASVLELSSSVTVLMVIFFSIPTAPTSYILTRQLGGDSELMAGIITAQTMFSAITLPIILGMLSG
ncbi:putative membrane protein [Proteus hauseri ATCC 700826]|uniref:Membrane protein n=1 Tax=Proteus hauseri ATCC 700826 TaxID=1354271 RepID=A0AAJ3HRS2_PROHU|nr:AEC family transporter [Proteus hauseri]OAT46522.1 putative membrane protein [Proteus hauseri ATCC 700826]